LLLARKEPVPVLGYSRDKIADVIPSKDSEQFYLRCPPSTLPVHHLPFLEILKGVIILKGGLGRTDKKNSYF
jgi:hypothetical protein